jgi:hypothetical protein
MANELRKLIEAPFKNSKSVQQIGIGGFNAAVRVSETYARTATVPTVFLEDGSHANDHIIRDPIILTISGDVSDVHVKSSSVAVFINNIETSIGSVSTYLPGKTKTQLSKISSIANDFTDAVSKIDSAIDRTQSLLSSFGASENVEKKNQERFIDEMDSLFEGDKLFSIDMPFRTYDNMVMTSFQCSYDNKGDSTSFEITATQFRFASTITKEIKSIAPETKGSLDSEVNKGVQEPQKVNTSILKDIF